MTSRAFLETDSFRTIFTPSRIHPFPSRLPARLVLILLSLAILGLLALLGAQSASAQTVTRTVGADAACDFDDIQEAIDEIVAIPATERIVQINRGSFDDVELTAFGTSLTLRGGFTSCSATEPTVVRSILNGTGAMQVARIGTLSELSSRAAADPPRFVLENLELRGGRGGLLVTGTADVEVVNGLIIDNERVRGGGIFVNASGGPIDLDLIDTGVNGNQTVVSGTTRPDGAGIYCTGNAVLRAAGGGITGNTTAADGRGGGMLLDGCAFEAFGRHTINLNRAFQGGGIAVINQRSDVLLASNADGNVRVRLNTAEERDGVPGQGGGIFLQSGELRVEAGRIEDNRAQPEVGPAGGQGGGIYSVAGRVEAFLATNPTCELPCITVDGNRADRGAAVFGRRTAIFTVRNTLFDNNVGDANVFEMDSDSAGTTTMDIRHSVVQRNVAPTIFDFGEVYSFTGKHLSIAENRSIFLDHDIFRLRDNPGGTPPHFELTSSILFQPTATLVNPSDSVTPEFDCMVVSDDLFIDGPRVVEADPLFVDAPRGDLHLEETSPAIDLCPASSGLDIDHQQVPIDQVVVPDDGTPADAGADEVGFIAPPEPPFFADGFESGDLEAWSDTAF